MKREPRRWVGRPLRRLDGATKLRGDALFTDDLRLPGMLVGKMLRSPHAHARILSIDTANAEALAGVKAVAVGEEMPVRYGILPRAEDETALAVGKVRYVGEPVAAVAAIDEATALAALDLIDVRYDPLPAIFDPREAMTREDVKIHAETKVANIERQASLLFGDVEGGFAAADHVREDTFFKAAATHAPIETHAALAQYSGGKLTLWSSTQVPHYLHRALAKVLELPLERIRVVKPFVGGGFGGKGEPFSLEFVASHLARKTGRPVKIVHTREEVFLSHRGRHPMHMTVKLGVKADGTITALHFRNILDGGCYGSYGLVTLYYSGQLLTCPYVIPAYRFDGFRVHTNKPPSGAQRGHGGVSPRYAIDVQLDRVAEDLGIDPLEIRLRNAVQPDSVTVNDLRITSCAFSECLEQVGSAISWKERRGKLPRGRGVGMAGGCYLSGAGKAIYFNPMPHSSVRITADRGGGVTVFSGAADIGQGSDTMLAVVAAETLGIAPSMVTVVSADTDTTPVDLGTYSSRVTFMAGNACLEAATQLRDVLLAAVAEELEVHVDTLEIRDGVIDGPGIDADPLTFADAIVLAESRGGPVNGVGGYTPPELGGSYRGAGVGPSAAYSFSAHAAEVEVDLETGHVEVVRLIASHDLGVALNPLAAEGQVEGGASMGLGETLMEDYEVLEGGQLACPSLLEYRIPTAVDLPDLETILVESVDPEGPYGAKECGEGSVHPTIPAVVNAVYDAVGVWLHEVPISPETILALMKKDQTRRVAPRGATRP